MTFLRKWTNATIASLVILMLVGNTPAMTQEHAVRPSELHKYLVDAARQRQADLDRVRGFFANEPASRALQHAAITPTKIEQALSSLDADELARLATRVDKVEKDFAGGALSNQQLTYIVIALATAIIILVIIEA